MFCAPACTAAAQFGSALKGARVGGARLAIAVYPQSVGGDGSVVDGVEECRRL